MSTRHRAPDPRLSSDKGPFNDQWASGGLRCDYSQIVERGTLQGIIKGASVDGAPPALLAPKLPHFPMRAKHVIFFFMNGGPSHVDLFDPKPALTKYNGTPYKGNPLLNLPTPEDVSPRTQRHSLNLLQRLNRKHLRNREQESELAARIHSYELAYRMQTTASEVVDVEQESEKTR